MTQSYQVMARRWRPQTFEEVCGQQAVVRTLRNAVAAGRLAHALLFTGPRGVGKTTTARLLAKALNCVKGPTADPCGTCESCVAVREGRQLNVLEIDGASNNRVEEARDLIETVQYAPGAGRWRMVIVDEVHMLSTAAFNALLKTVEEPPPNVVFVLATTEPHKVPATIHSRCQRHDFRRLTAQEIAASLTACLKADAHTGHARVEDGALQAIARAAHGSLRDGQSLLEQVLAYAGDAPTREDVEASLGLVRAERLAEAVDALAARATDRALALVDALHREGYDLRLFCQELVGLFRDLAVVKVCAAPQKLLEESRVPVEDLKRQAARLGLTEIELMQKALLQAEQEMRRAAAPRVALEMAMIRLGEIRALEPVPGLVTRLQELERRLGGPGIAAAAAPAPQELSLFGPPAPPAPPRPSPPDPVRMPAPGAVTLLADKPRPPAPPPAPSAPAPLPTPQAPTVVGASTLAGEGRTSQSALRSPDAGAGWQAARRLLESRKRIAVVLADSEAALQGETLEVTVATGSAFVRQALEEPEARRLVGDAVREAFGARLQVAYRYAAPRAASADHPGVRQALEIFEGRIAPARDAPGAAS